MENFTTSPSLPHCDIFILLEWKAFPSFFFLTHTHIYIYPYQSSPQPHFVGFSLQNTKYYQYTYILYVLYVLVL